MDFSDRKEQIRMVRNMIYLDVLGSTSPDEWNRPADELPIALMMTIRVPQGFSEMIDQTRLKFDLISNGEGDEGIQMLFQDIFAFGLKGMARFMVQERDRLLEEMSKGIKGDNKE